MVYHKVRRSKASGKIEILKGTHAIWLALLLLLLKFELAWHSSRWAVQHDEGDPGIALRGPAVSSCELHVSGGIANRVFSVAARSCVCNGCVPGHDP